MSNVTENRMLEFGKTLNEADLLFDTIMYYPMLLMTRHVFCELLITVSLNIFNTLCLIVTILVTLSG